MRKQGKVKHRWH